VHIRTTATGAADKEHRSAIVRGMRSFGKIDQGVLPPSRPDFVAIANELHRLCNGKMDPDPRWCTDAVVAPAGGIR
jgi:hypothetical protein